MDVIETAIDILKKKYQPPMVFSNEERIKIDLIRYFSCVIEDIIEILNARQTDSETTEKIRQLIKRAGLKDVTPNK